MDQTDAQNHRNPQGPDLPFDAELLRGAEQRYNAIKGNAPGHLPGAFEVLESAREVPVAPSRGRVARDLLSSNPPDAIARRLRRIGVAGPTAEKAADVVVTERSAGDGLEVLDSGTADGGTEEQLVLERIIGRNELLGIQYLDGGQAASRSVARVVIRNAIGATIGFGTGSLISPRLFLTNNHVLGDAATAGRSVIEFNFQDDLRGSLLPTVRFRLEPATFFTTSPLGSLDFTVVGVAEVADDGTSLSQFGFNPLGALEGEILAGESVTIIQHPNGEPKQIALRENLVLKFPEADDQFLHYQTDTSPGSSGSPVYNDQWELVALHHAGFPKKDAAGNILATDGRIWKQEMGEHKIDWVANEGIRARAIAGILRGLDGLTPSQKILRDQVLAPSGGERSPAHAGAGEPASSGRPQVTRASDAAGQPAAGTQAGTMNLVAGQAQWTIPIRVSIDLGSPIPSAVGPAKIEPGDAASSLKKAATTFPGGVGLTPTDDETIRAAKAEAGRAAARVYLDEAAEAAAKDTYYRGVAPGASPSDFSKTLGRLLETTHTTRPKYAPSRMLYPWVDLQPDKRIKSVYSGQEFDPIELIELDAEVDRARSERLEAFRAMESADGPMAIELEAALLEAGLPYNCEHVVPQSWFSQHEPMRGDMHHLFACESGCNSFRGNIPYFDFRGGDETVRIGCGRREADRFQPTAGLGAVARATLYFLTRYPGTIRAGSSTYTADRIKVLLGWHEEFPVSKYERHRNQAIFEVQGNRNPLIDHPEWASKLDFPGGLA